MDDPCDVRRHRIRHSAGGAGSWSIPGVGLLWVRSQTVLSVGANRSAGNMIERTQRRLRQARFFYQHLVNARHGDPEAFRFYFSAFIQSARSVTWALKKEESEKWKKWEPTWRANRSEGERKLLKIATDLRNVESEGRRSQPAHGVGGGSN